MKLQGLSSFLFLCFFALFSCAHEPRRSPADVNASPLRIHEEHAGRQGALSALVEWTIDPETQNDVLHGRLEFLPFFPKASCGRIGFVQIAQATDNRGKSVIWRMGEAPRNEMATSEGHFYVDHQAQKCAPHKACSPFFADHWPNEGESSFGYSKGGKGKPATLSDYPYGWSELSSVALEACAVCAESFSFMGCVRWGGVWPATGQQGFLPLVFGEKPSADFKEALQLFFRYYKEIPK